MKAISAELRAHLQSAEPKTTAVCWQIQRVKDGKSFYFTDHDRPLLIGADTYEPQSGLSRSSLKTSGDLSPENMSVAGIFDSDQIRNEDMIKGLFDGAKVFVFFVNYADLTQGILRLTSGRFGEVTRTTNNSFEVELRDLTQLLAQPHGMKRQPECRANVGDEFCNNAHPNLPWQERNPVPINVPERLDSTPYARGDVIKVATGTDVGATLGSVPIVNGGFNDGPQDDTPTGWTPLSGSWWARAEFNGLTPLSGAYFLVGRFTASPDTQEIRQDIDMTGESWWDNAAVDAGDYALNVSGWRANSDPKLDTGRIRWQALDGGGAVIGTIYDSGAETISPQDTWVSRSGLSLPIPANTRQLRCLLTSVRVSNPSEAAYDEISAFVTDTTAAAGTSRVYENRTYRCITAGTTAASTPAYDMTVGNDTTDGTAVFKAEESLTRHGTVLRADNQKAFVAIDADFNDPLFDRPYFNLGAIIWEEGLNEFWVSEVETGDPPIFTLLFPTPFLIQTGDRFTVYPGCDLRRNTCIAKFNNIANFRGEPDLPGSDAYTQYPDAKT